MGESPEEESQRRLQRALRGLRGGASSEETSAYRYVGLGLTFALAILLFFVLGYALDSYLGTLPIFSLIGAFVGGIGGFLHLYHSVIRETDTKPPVAKPPAQ